MKSSKVNLASLAIFLLFIMLFEFQSNAQSSFSKIVDQEFYARSALLVNGKIWSNSLNYKGHQFCHGAEWKKGNVLFGGVYYKDVLLNYDIHRSRLILFYKDGITSKYIELNNELVEAFDYLYAGEIHRFVTTDLLGEKELFEEVFTGSLSIYVKHKKGVHKRANNIYLGAYYERSHMYLQNKIGVFRVDSTSSLLKSLGNAKLLKKFIRKHGLYVDKDHVQDIVSLLTYFESLELI